MLVMEEDWEVQMTPVNNKSATSSIQHVNIKQLLFLVLSLQKQKYSEQNPMNIKDCTCCTP
jgi:hypothetical protein